MRSNSAAGKESNEGVWDVAQKFSKSWSRCRERGQQKVSKQAVGRIDQKEASSLVRICGMMYLVHRDAVKCFHVLKGTHTPNTGPARIRMRREWATIR